MKRVGSSISTQTSIVCHSSTKIAYLKDGTFTQVFFQVQLNVSCSLKFFAGLLSFVDMNSKTMHTDVLFGYSYSVVRPHFKSNRSLDVNCTLSNCY